MHPLFRTLVIFNLLLGLLSGNPFALLLAAFFFLVAPRAPTLPPVDPDDPWPNRPRCPRCGHTGLLIRPQWRTVRNPFLPGFGTQRRWHHIRCLNAACHWEWGRWDPADEDHP